MKKIIISKSGDPFFIGDCSKMEVIGVGRDPVD